MLGHSRGRSPRFPTPNTMRRVSLGDRRSESPNKYMDVDPGRFPTERRYSEESRVFAVSDTLSIRLAASLPAELHQEFQSSGALLICYCSLFLVINTWQL